MVKLLQSRPLPPKTHTQPGHLLVSPSFTPAPPAFLWGSIQSLPSQGVCTRRSPAWNIPPPGLCPQYSTFLLILGEASLITLAEIIPVPPIQPQVVIYIAALFCFLPGTHPPPPKICNFYIFVYMPINCPLLLKCQLHDTCCHIPAPKTLSDRSCVRHKWMCGWIHG